MRILVATALFSVLATTEIAYAFPGVAPPGTAAAEYYSNTGEIIVSVNDVLTWQIESDSFGLNGDAPLHLPVSNGFVTDQDNFLGESVGIGGTISFSNLNLGNIAATGLPGDDLSIFWQSASDLTLHSTPLTYLGSPPPGNAPPTAFIGGPYEVDIDNGPLNILLDAGNSIDDGLAGALSYKWDLDDNGTFEVDTGIVSTFEVSDVTTTFGGLGSYPIAVEIFDGEFFDVSSTVVDLVPDTAPMPIGPGPAPVDGVIAAYDPATGRIVVSVNDVVNWYVGSASASLTGDPAMGIPAGGGFLSDNNEIVGETTGFLGMTYTNLDLGNVAAKGLPLSDLTIYWNPGPGIPLESQPVILLMIPEPTTLLLAAFGLTIITTMRRRQNVA